jgi:photosystem II stability/assembly factor-like uncharacterized protein
VTRELAFLSASDGEGHGFSYRSTDGGRTWSALELPTEPSLDGTVTGSTFSDALHGYLRRTATRVSDNRVSLDRQIFTTDDGGATWTYRFELEMEGRWSLVRLDDETWIANNGTERRLSADGGRTWQLDDVSGLPDPAEYVSADFVDAEHGWATSAPACLADFCAFIWSNLFASVDGGLTWSLVGDCGPNSDRPYCPAQKP